MTFALLSTLLLALPQEQAAKPYKVITFKELVQELRSHKGKVVVVDLWTDG
jgi:hypothetical protein